jgi:hypothetical protein
MCYIYLFGATAGGIVARKYYYELKIDGNGEHPTIYYKDKDAVIKRNLSKLEYEKIMRYVIDNLKKIPSGKEGVDTSYRGLELFARCHDFNWFNAGPGGCVHSPPAFHASKQQQQVYDHVVDYLKKIGIAL